MVDGRTTDGRRLDGYTISSPCEPNGSGELITVSAIICNQKRCFYIFDPLSLSVKSVHDCRLANMTILRPWIVVFEYFSILSKIEYLPSYFGIIFKVY